MCRYICEIRTDMDVLEYRRAELQKISQKLHKDYYPVTGTLCSNAYIQANWLYENSSELMGDSIELFRKLQDSIKQHIELCSAILYAFFEMLPAEKAADCIQALSASRQDVEQVLNEIAGKKLFEQHSKNDMFANLRIKMTVINNIVSEIFKIETEKIIPLLKEEF